MQINVGDDKLTNYSSSAKGELQKQLISHADLIIKESNLIEYALREENTNSEITATIVASAAKKSQVNRPKKYSPVKIIVKIISWISMIFVGALFDIEKCQNSTTQLVWLIIVIVIATGTSILQFFWEESR